MTPGAIGIQWQPQTMVMPRSGRQPLTLTEVSLIGLLFQVMDLLPPVSLDYRLGMHVVPFLLLATRKRPDGQVLNGLHATVIVILAGTLAYYSIPGEQPYRAAALGLSLLCYLAMTMGSLTADADRVSAAPRLEPAG